MAISHFGLTRLGAFRLTRLGARTRAIRRRVAVLNRDTGYISVLDAATGAELWTMHEPTLVDTAYSRIAMDHDGNVVLLHWPGSLLKYYYISGTYGSITRGFLVLLPVEHTDMSQDVGIDSGNRIFAYGALFNADVTGPVWKTGTGVGGPADAAGNFYARLNYQPGTLESYDAAGNVRWSVDIGDDATVANVNCATTWSTGLTATVRNMATGEVFLDGYTSGGSLAWSANLTDPPYPALPFQAVATRVTATSYGSFVVAMQRTSPTPVVHLTYVVNASGVASQYSTADPTHFADKALIDPAGHYYFGQNGGLGGSVLVKRSPLPGWTYAYGDVGSDFNLSP